MDMIASFIIKDLRLASENWESNKHTLIYTGLIEVLTGILLF